MYDVKLGVYKSDGTSDKKFIKANFPVMCRKRFPRKIYPELITTVREVLGIEDENITIENYLYKHNNKKDAGIQVKEIICSNFEMLLDNLNGSIPKNFSQLCYLVHGSKKI